jgi:hypothetical protein
MQRVCGLFYYTSPSPRLVFVVLGRGRRETGNRAVWPARPPRELARLTFVSARERGI